MAAEQVNGCEGPDGAADPEGAVHDEVDGATNPSGDQFIHRGVDRGVFTPDTYAGEGAKDREREEAPGPRDSSTWTSRRPASNELPLASQTGIVMNDKRRGSACVCHSLASPFVGSVK
jgi:hypothetical protein